VLDDPLIVERSDHRQQVVARVSARVIGGGEIEALRWPQTRSWAGGGNVTRMPLPSVLSVLRERAGLQPDDNAFTYTDYELDWAGVAESLTRSQLYRRTLNVAHELNLHGSVGDRAVILAPQGLDYVEHYRGEQFIRLDA